MLTAGGILSIIAGISQIIGGLLLAGIISPSLPFPDFFLILGYIMLFLLPLGDLWGSFLYGLMGVPVLISICTGVLGIMAVIGGISAIKRKWFSISLAGGICALPSVPLGILAVNFVVLGKREFRAKA
ncbi:MAG TPA: hypothetical protein VMV76_03590 [Dehalococcoidia bacterium]|nr:hypothetical protein [Dehalococcoidia bacterium]